MAREQGQPKRVRGKKGGSYIDYNLLACCIITILLGFILLYSASAHSSTSVHSDSLFMLKRQVLATALGIVAFVFIMKVGYKFLEKYANLIYYVSLASILLVLTPLGKTSNGARRWVELGFIQFQPAELVKIGVIIVTAAMIAKCKNNTLKNGKVAFLIFLRTAVAAGLLFVITSNMSSAIIVLVIGLTMLIVAGPGIQFYKYFAIFSGAVGVSYAIYNMVFGSGFRGERIMVWLNPEQYSESGGFQVMQGLFAIGSGGFFGKGLGNSMQKLGPLPEATNDMIFSIICEELGLFGAACVIALFVFMIFRMRSIAMNVPKSDLFGSMLVVGVMVQIATQVIMNIAVVTNSMPNTGVSLPFISYGGTSLVFLIAEMGLVLSVSKTNMMRD